MACNGFPRQKHLCDAHQKGIRIVDGQSGEHAQRQPDDRAHLLERVRHAQEAQADGTADDERDRQIGPAVTC